MGCRNVDRGDGCTSATPMSTGELPAQNVSLCERGALCCEGGSEAGSVVVQDVAGCGKLPRRWSLGNGWKRLRKQRINRRFGLEGARLPTAPLSSSEQLTAWLDAMRSQD